MDSLIGAFLMHPQGFPGALKGSVRARSMMIVPGEVGVQLL